jgi:DNA-binding CsgD family transcriptional regulator
LETAEDKIQKLAPFADLLPGVVIIHEIADFSDFKTVFMSSKGLDQLGVSMSELSQMGSKYHERFFNNEDMEGFMIKLEKLLHERDASETFTFFQQVKFKDRDEWVWHIGSIRIFHQDKNGHPTHTITVSFPVDQMKHIPNKAERLLAENTFFRNNLEKFHGLGERAKEVLRLVALGRSSAEISEELNITVDTVNTHRKIIKRKLGIQTTYEFTEYAHAFDLI